MSQCVCVYLYTHLYTITHKFTGGNIYPENESTEDVKIQLI